MHYVDTLPIVFVGTIFVLFFGYLLYESFLVRQSNQDKDL
jgi:hypothetical protein